MISSETKKPTARERVGKFLADFGENSEIYAMDNWIDMAGYAACGGEVATSD